MKTLILITMSISTLLASSIVWAANAPRYKLSHEVNISDTRKICVYVTKDGSTIQKEQAKNQYCRSVL